MKGTVITPREREREREREDSFHLKRQESSWNMRVCVRWGSAAFIEDSVNALLSEPVRNLSRHLHLDRICININTAAHEHATVFQRISGLCTRRPSYGRLNVFTGWFSRQSSLWEICHKSLGANFFKKKKKWLVMFLLLSSSSSQDENQFYWWSGRFGHVLYKESGCEQ